MIEMKGCSSLIKDYPKTTHIAYQIDFLQLAKTG